MKPLIIFKFPGEFLAKGFFALLLKIRGDVNDQEFKSLIFDGSYKIKKPMSNDLETCEKIANDLYNVTGKNGAIAYEHLEKAVNFLERFKDDDPIVNHSYLCAKDDLEILNKYRWKTEMKKGEADRIRDITFHIAQRVELNKHFFRTKDSK